ncbi:Nucleotidyl transferase [Selenomonas ruminantium]|uniref:Nucleotidyl transferase n=1 Tax=Selenomonas ruminantium TaxID=971 RepID=A0A1M6W2S9_SELRU|nr:glycosyltransferase family 2 protein [Selenomonas ruminantium]SHK88074.1 Nucleotidyl transferase [Selenomonas ruminantium]
MINILIPAMGESSFFKESYFPKPMIEIKGKSMLEMVVDDYKNLDSRRHIFIFNDDDCRKFHLDDSVRMLTSSSYVIRLHNQTAGALCTCLMAVDYIQDDEPLIIANSDQIIMENYEKVICHFEAMKADCGIITFSSIHPRWSYAKIVGDDVVESAEKRPISRNAIAGFYYYRYGKIFVDAAKKVLLKKNNLDGKYYISSTINELILMGKKISFYEIDKNQYKSFYSPEKIKEFEEGAK